MRFTILFLVLLSGCVTANPSRELCEFISEEEQKDEMISVIERRIIEGNHDLTEEQQQIVLQAIQRHKDSKWIRRQGVEECDRRFNYKF